MSSKPVSLSHHIGDGFVAKLVNIEPLSIPSLAPPPPFQIALCPAEIEKPRIAQHPPPQTCLPTISSLGLLCMRPLQQATGSLEPWLHSSSSSHQ